MITSVIEGFFNILKQERIHRLTLQNFAQARGLVSEYISFYNTKRIQMKSGQTPLELRSLSA